MGTDMDLVEMGLGGGMGYFAFRICWVILWMMELLRYSVPSR